MRVAPVRSATASRAGLTSATVTSVAPKASAHCWTSRPIGPAPVTSTRSPARTPAFWQAHTPTGERLDQRARLVGDAVGEREREVLVDGDEVRERAVDRRRREEAHVLAEVVAAGAALAALAARHARLERHPVADGVARHPRADRHDPAGGLVAEDHRGLDDERADAPVLVVVHVGAADPDGGDLDEDLARPGLRDLARLDAQVARGVQDGGAVGR